MKDNRYWVPRCPSCGSYEVDFIPFTDGREWECHDCGMNFNSDQQEEADA